MLNGYFALTAGVKRILIQPDIIYSYVVDLGDKKLAAKSSILQ